jgi:hypothetical protein
VAERWRQSSFFFATKLGIPEQADDSTGAAPCLGQFHALLGTAYIHDSDFIDRAIDPEANPPPIELGSVDHAPVCGADLIFHGCQWVFG